MRSSVQPLRSAYRGNPAATRYNAPTLYKEIGRFRLAGLGPDCRALGAVLGEFSESF